MKFLKSPGEIESVVKQLTRKCSQLRWAVAWASHDFPLFHLLKENESKIRQLTVGIHFYQTHPNFIGAFLSHDAVRFVMNPDGVFHPKLYLFEFENGAWECVTGSPNWDLNHCRSESIRLTDPIEVPQILAAIMSRSS